MGENEDDQEFMDIAQKVDDMDKEKMTEFIIQVPGMSTKQSTEDMREILIEHLYRMKLLEHLDREDEEKGVIFKPDWTKSSFWEEEDDDDEMEEEKKSWEKGIKKKGWLGVPDLRRVKKEKKQWEKLKEWDLRERFSQTDGDKIFASKEVDKIINERQWSELWPHPINYENNLWDTIPGVTVRQQGEWDPMDHLRFSEKMKRYWMLNEWSQERRNEEVVQAQTANSEQEEGVEESPLDPSQPSVITARQREAPSDEETSISYEPFSQAEEHCIERLKAMAPIWKKEVYSSGEGSWKANRECAWAPQPPHGS